MDLIIFYIAGLLTIIGAIGVVASRNIIYAALGLLVSLISVGMLFLIAYAEFLAMVQILIYGGAIIVVILFTLMLTRITDFANLTDNRQWPVAIISSLLLFGVIGTAALTTNTKTSTRESVEFESFSKTLFVDWAVPFEIASLVLLVALIGAIVMVREIGNRS